MLHDTSKDEQIIDSKMTVGKSLQKILLYAMVTQYINAQYI